MFLDTIDLLTRAQLAEYERGVEKLLLVSEARAAARPSGTYPRPVRPSHHWWVLGRRSQSPAV